MDISDSTYMDVAVGIATGTAAERLAAWRALDGRAETAAVVADCLLYMCEEAHRLQGNVCDEDIWERVEDLLDEAFDASLLSDGDQLEFVGVALAVTAGRGGLWCSPHLLGDIQHPERLLRALHALVRLRVRRLAEWSMQDEAACMALVVEAARAVTPTPAG